MDGAGGCSAAEDVAPLSCGLLLKLKRELVRAESALPRRPRLVGGGEAVPVGALLGEAALGEERASGDGGEPFVINWELRSDQFLLGVLKTINVLGDAWVLGPPAEGYQEKGDNVGGLEAAAAALEAREKVSEGHLVVKGRLFF